ncbi:MAG: hypothetical protein J6B05_02150 [Clostridia bacterium]|nr:hypothetical protein [Clostridia bacterium]
MVTIFNEVIKRQKNFWNNCLFHPTDAVEDDWGRRILDQMAEDKAIQTVRIYTMFEDIVSLDENGNLRYDFTENDVRLDYLLEKGYDLLLAYGSMPDCIARDKNSTQSNSKNKTRYKGKMWNTSPPKSPELWEEVCYQYTKHIVERYGVERVNSWHCQCFNEPDIVSFFMKDEPYDSIRRVEEYVSMYEGFVKGIRRAGTSISVGGPTLAQSTFFLEEFLKAIKEKNLEINYFTMHLYGTAPAYLTTGDHGLSVWGNIERQRPKIELIKKYGFENIPLIADEWGAASMGFFNKEECKFLMFRETEINAAYYVRFIYLLIHRLGMEMEKMLICLSGQHEMTEDFSGFRNFFTLNFIKKPIYNAYVLASKLGENLLRSSADITNFYPLQKDILTVLPTKRDDGSYAVLLCYGEGNFLIPAEDREETFEFEEDIREKTVTVWCIDKEHTNPYRYAQKMGWKDLTKEQIEILREEGNLKPILVTKGVNAVTLKLTAGATFLITVE